MQLSDYAQALGAAQRLVPDFRDQQQQDAQTRVLQMQPALIGQQIAASQQNQALEGQEAAYKQDRRGAFTSALAGLGAKPTPDKLYRLGIDFPEFAQTINQAAKGVTEDKRAGVVRQLAPIQALIQNGQTDKALAEVNRHIKADQAAGMEPDENDVELRDMLASGDPDQIKAAGGIVYGLLSAVNPDTAAANIGKQGEDQFSSTGDGAIYNKRTGEVVREGRQKAEYRTIKNADGSESIVQVNGEGGGPTSSGGAAGTRGDVSRLINSDAGGGYVPDSVKTLGQFVSYGRDMNRRGATSSSAGTYQINGTTMAEFAPKALGADWRTAPFNAENQDKVGKAIFDWAKQQSNPAAALKGRWVSLSAQSAANLVKGSWEQAKGTIAQGETGGGPRASASAQSGARFSKDGAKVIFTSSAKPKEGGDAMLDASTITAMAEQYLAGDKSVMQNLGRGAQGSANIVKLRGEISRQARAAGMTGRDIAAQMADFAGIMAGERAAGTRIANVELASSEAIKLIPLALEASNALPRSSFLPFSKAQQKIASGTNDPRLRKFVAANNALVNVYSRAVSPTGAPTVSDKEHARELLDTAYDQRSYAAVVGQMQREIEAAREAPRDVRGDLHRAVGNGRGQVQPARVSPPQGGKLVGMYQGRQVFQLPNGKRVVAK